MAKISYILAKTYKEGDFQIQEVNQSLHPKPIYNVTKRKSIKTLGFAKYNVSLYDSLASGNRSGRPATFATLTANKITTTRLTDHAVPHCSSKSLGKLDFSLQMVENEQSYRLVSGQTDRTLGKWKRSKTSENTWYLKKKNSLGEKVVLAKFKMTDTVTSLDIYSDKLDQDSSGSSSQASSQGLDDDNALKRNDSSLSFDSDDNICHIDLKLFDVILLSCLSLRANIQGHGHGQGASSSSPTSPVSSTLSHISCPASILLSPLSSHSSHISASCDILKPANVAKSILHM